MRSFFKQLFGPAEAPASYAPSTHAPSTLGGHRVSATALDIETAKASHVLWKLRLRDHLDGRSTEDFSPEVICFDDRCELGQWIHGPARARLGKYAAFTALENHHRMFHYAAANVVSLHRAGQSEQARQMLNLRLEEFSRAVLADLDLLQIMRRRRHRVARSSQKD